MFRDENGRVICTATCDPISDEDIEDGRTQCEACRPDSYPSARDFYVAAHWDRTVTSEPCNPDYKLTHRFMEPRW
jgi:hypothetical protein